MSKGRRLAGSAALLATAAGVGAIAWHDRRWVEWGLVACSAILALAAVGLGRKSITAQVLSRATAWLVLAPAALVTVISALVGHSTELAAVALTAGSGAALLLSRPMLHTPEARAEFAPTRFRSWLLAGATASAATGIMAGSIGVNALAHGHSLGAGVAFGALGLALLGSAIGVARMRAWGVLLGALTSIVTLAAAAFMHDAAGVVLSLAAVPGMVLLLPVLVAKRERAADEALHLTRVATYPSLAAEGMGPRVVPSRVRVASVSRDPFAEQGEAGEAAEAGEEIPPARAQHV